MVTSRQLAPYIAAMTIIVAASNYLVRIPFTPFGLQEILTWGALTYPIAFLVNDLTNRKLGTAATHKVIYVGFLLAVIASLWLSTPRIALASGMAFLLAQLLDASLFDLMRRQQWWKAPLISSAIASVLDTLIFFSLAFAGMFSGLDATFGSSDGSLAFPVTKLGIEIPLWLSLALGDMLVKFAIGLAMLVPYRMLSGSRHDERTEI